MKRRNKNEFPEEFPSRTMSPRFSTGGKQKREGREIDGWNNSITLSCFSSSFPSHVLFLHLNFKERIVHRWRSGKRKSSLLRQKKISLQAPKKTRSLFVLSLAGWRNIQTSLLEKRAKSASLSIEREEDNRSARNESQISARVIVRDRPLSLSIAPIIRALPPSKHDF